MKQTDQSLQQSYTDLQKCFCAVNDYARAMDQRASDTVETVLKMFLSPAAFYALEAFHQDTDRASGRTGMSFLDALESLSCREGVEELERTLAALKKNEDFL